MARRAPIRWQPDAYRSTPLQVSVRVDEQRSKIIRSKVDIRKRVRELLGEAAKRILRSIAAKSPVRTGKFKGGWQAEASGGQSIRVTNPVAYAAYVHPKGTPPSRTVANTDLPLVLTEVQSWIDSELQSRGILSAVEAYVRAEVLDAASVAAASTGVRDAGQRAASAIRQQLPPRPVFSTPPVRSRRGLGPMGGSAFGDPGTGDVLLRALGGRR